MEPKVKNTPKRRSMTRISSKHQVTIPRDAFHDAGLQPGDRLQAEARGPGRIVLVRAESATVRYAGVLDGVYRPGELDELRDEWD